MFFAKLGASLAEMKLKLIIGGIIIALLAGAWFAWDARGEKIDKLKEDVLIAKVENGSLKDTNDTQTKSGAITEKVNTELATAEKKVDKKHDKIAAKVEAKIDAIDARFDSLPETPKNKADKSLETATVLIDGLWDSFCSASPGAPECKGRPAAVTNT